MMINVWICGAPHRLLWDKRTLIFLKFLRSGSVRRMRNHEILEPADSFHSQGFLRHQTSRAIGITTRVSAPDETAALFSPVNSLSNHPRPAAVLDSCWPPHLEGNWVIRWCGHRPAAITLKPTLMPRANTVARTQTYWWRLFNIVPLSLLGARANKSPLLRLSFLEHLQNTEADVYPRLGGEGLLDLHVWRGFPRLITVADKSLDGETLMSQRWSACRDLQIDERGIVGGDVEGGGAGCRRETDVLWGP